MNPRNYLLVGAGILAAAVAVLLVPSVLADNDPDIGGGTVSGDWTVEDSRDYDAVTIYVQAGSVIVINGGTLDLNAVNLYFDSTEDGTYSLTVEKGGTLLTDGFTRITSTNSAVHYKFIVQGSMTMNATLVSEVWGDNASWAGGIQVYSDSVSITNCTIYDGMTGGISIFDCSPYIGFNVVRNNGRDGASAQYCFGIYAWNSRSFFESNTVSDNTCKIITSERNTFTQTKSGSGVYWNGNSYNGWYRTGTTYYCYRYQYDRYYYYGRSEYYGTGICIQGGSDITLKSNRVEHNGYGAAGYNYQYSYQQIVEYRVRPGIHGATYWDEYRLYYYLYRYTYNSVRCFGVGLRVDDSNLELEANTFNENGFRSSHSNIPSIDYVGYYSGVNCDLYNSTGNITNNTINNAAILLNLTRCNFLINGNKFLGDHMGTYYSVGVIPGRIAYGIRFSQSKGNITNNIIDMKYKDYPMSLGGSTVYFADQVIAVEVPQAKGTLFANNRVTADSQYYGMVPSLLFNTSLRATGLKVLNCQFEFKYSGSVSTTKPTMTEVQVGLKSEAYFENCTFKAPGAASYAPRVFGLAASYGTELEMVNCTFTSHHVALYITDYSRLTAYQVNFTGIVESCIYLEYMGRANLTSCKLLGTGRGIQAVLSTVEVHDCYLSNPVEFHLARGSLAEVYNTTHTRYAVTMMDNDSYLNISWPVTVVVQWQNDVPVDGAQLLFATMAGEEVYAGTTGPDGRPAPMLWMKEYMAHAQVITKYTPHRVTASKGRAQSMELFLVDQPTDITFRLIDGIAPDLFVSYPFDGQMLKDPLVTMTGHASDPEAGLLDNLVYINMDNEGWIPVTVTDEGWTYTKFFGDGAHVVRVRGEDLVGNGARASLSFSIDTTAPALFLFSPTEGCYTNQRTITVSGISEENAFVSVNGILVQMDRRYFTTQISLEDGPNAVVVAASDGSGNYRTVTVRVTLDTVAPFLEITSPARGAFLNQDPVSVIGTTEPTAQVRVNGYPAQLSGTDFEALVDLSEGTNTITVVSFDPAGNSRTVQFLVTLDTAPPDVSLFTPRDELWTNLSRVMVSGATESGASITINGQNTNVINTVFSNYITLAEGQNRIEVSARDLAGNRFSVVRTVYLDTRMPDLVLTSPAPKAILSNRIVPVVGSVDWGAEVTVNGVLVALSDFVFSTTVAFTEDGAQVIEVAATDLAGNTAVVTRTVTVDTSTPAITLSYPDDLAKVKVRTITITGQTEPYATIIVNSETMIQVGRDGLFAVPVVLEDGENRVIVQATDTAGNLATETRTLTRVKAAPPPVEDLSWVLNLTGLLIGIGVALPIATFALTDSWRRRRTRVLAEIEAAEAERRQREELARRPTLERIGKKRVKEPLPPKPEEPRPPAEPPKLAEPPKPEAAPTPEAVKVGLKDRSGAADASAEETEAPTKVETPKAPEAPKAEEPPASPETGLKDKGSEAEGAAEETEVRARK